MILCFCQWDDSWRGDSICLIESHQRQFIPSGSNYPAIQNSSDNVHLDDYWAKYDFISALSDP